MKQCKAVVKILNALDKSQIIGISEFSAFYIRQQNETKIEREKCNYIEYNFFRKGREGIDIDNPHRGEGKGPTKNNY